MHTVLHLSHYQIARPCQPGAHAPLKPARCVPASVRSKRKDTAANSGPAAPDAAKRMRRGPGVDLGSVKDKKLRGKLKHAESVIAQSQRKAAAINEWLLPSTPGTLEVEGGSGPRGRLRLARRASGHVQVVALAEVWRPLLGFRCGRCLGAQGRATGLGAAGGSNSAPLDWRLRTRRRRLDAR